MKVTTLISEQTDTKKRENMLITHRKVALLAILVFRARI